jgi:hypothetical protein
MTSFKNVDESILPTLLSEARLSTYIEDTDTMSNAIKLYNWNTSASAAMLGLIAMTEVTLRNALSSQLHQKYLGDPEPWLSRIPLDSRGRADIERAESKAKRKVHSHTHNDIISELNFGFWRYLLNKRYLTTLWFPCLSKAFPFNPKDIPNTQKYVEYSVDRLYVARNRIAHHEPIHRRDLTKDYRAAIGVMEMIHPHAAEWVRQESTLPFVVRQRPLF